MGYDITKGAIIGDLKQKQPVSLQSASQMSRQLERKRLDPYIELINTLIIENFKSLEEYGDIKARYTDGAILKHVDALNEVFSDFDILYKEPFLIIRIKKTEG